MSIDQQGGVQPRKTITSTDAGSQNHKHPLIYPKGYTDTSAIRTRPGNDPGGITCRLPGDQQHHHGAHRRVHPCSRAYGGRESANPARCCCHLPGLGEQPRLGQHLGHPGQVWVPETRPSRSSGMCIPMEGTGESIVSMDFEVVESTGIGDRLR
jgi:hypothetical protein